MTELEAPARAWQRHVVVPLIVASLVAGAAGNALTPLLLRESPIGLLLVHASYPQMALVSPRLDPVTFVAVAGIRRWLGESVYFFGGRVLGAELLAWYAHRRGKPLRLPHRLNHRWRVVRDAVVVFLPHPLVSAFFGAVGMPWARYLLLKLVGSLVSVAAFWYVAGVVPTAVAADFVEANAVAITAVGLLAAGAWWWWRRRRGAAHATSSEGAA